MRKNKKKNYIGLGLLFLIGLSILLYPMVSDAWNRYRDSLLISDYSSSVSSDDNAEKIDSMWKAAQEYNEQIKQESVPDAFSVRDGQTDSTYESLEKGAGHLFGSSLPVGGKSTHCILSAHRGLPSAKLFTDLNLVEEGDVFYLHVLGKTLAYEVDQILTVLPEQTESLGITDGDDYVTLVTCTPYAVNTHRLLVRGHRVPMKAAKAVQKTEKKVTGITNPTLPMLALCVVIGIVIAVILVTGINSVQNKKRRRK